MENNIEKTAEIINEKLANKVDRNEVDALKLQVKDLESAAEALTAKMQGLTGVENKKDKKETFLDVVQKYKNDFELMFQKRQSGFEMVVNKAVFEPGSVANDTYGNRLTTVGKDLSGNAMWVDELFGRIPWLDGTNGNIIFYDEKVEDLVRAAKEYAFNGTITEESTYALDEITLEVGLIADIIPINEFSLSDTPKILAIETRIKDFLRDNIGRKERLLFMNGDITTINQFSGLLKLAPTFDHATFGADPENKVQSANIVDVAAAMKATCESAGEKSIVVDYAVVNRFEVNKLRRLKDANDQYLFPKSMSLEQIFGVNKVYVTNDIAKNKLVMGDSRYPKLVGDPNIYLTMERGSGDNLKKFKYDIRVHKRSALLIYKTALAAQIKSIDLTAAKAAINLA